MIRVFFDTETTGLPSSHDAPPEQYPRLCQLAFLVYQDEKKIIEASLIVKPEGFIIPAEVAAIHGITQEKAEAEGLPLADVLGIFKDFLNMSSGGIEIIANNLEYDRKVISGEFFRIMGAYPSFDKIKTFCTMREGSIFLKTLKYPKLKEIYAALFGAEFQGQHNALNDVRACARVYFEMKRRNEAIK